jgi:hypothetical protein
VHGVMKVCTIIVKPSDEINHVLFHDLHLMIRDE